MPNAKIKGKQLDDITISLNKLSGSGTVSFTSPSQIQIIGTASNPNDVVTFKELSGFGSSLQVTDYITGLTFSNIENIIFRGQTVTVPSGTATGVLSEGGGLNTVTVWIPAPNYVDYFNTDSNAISDEGTTQRFVSLPTSPGTPFKIGDWTAGSTTVDVLDEPSGQDVVYTCTDFAVFDLTTLVYIYFYDADGFVTSTGMIVATGSTTADGLTINVTSVSPNQDRYKASVTFTADLSHASLISSGGRFSIVLAHENSTDGTFTYSQSDIFYDSDGAGSNANIDIPGGGTVSIIENIPTLKYVSGVAFYDSNSTFTFSVTNIDNLNDRSFPRGTADSTNNSSGQQLRLTPSNFATSTTFWGHSSDFTGWTTSYNVQDLEYYTVSTINTSNAYEPDFTDTSVPYTSNGVASSVSSITAILLDWNTADTESSPDYAALIDTFNGSSDYDTEDFIDESTRQDFSSLGITASFVSNVVLPSDSLQVLFGRLVYPQTNFVSYYPEINATNNWTNYTSASGANKSFDIFTDVGSNPTSYSAGVAINNYRWYCRAMGLNSGYTTNMTNIIITFTNDNFAETDIHYEWTGSGYSAGNEDLVILVGIDTSGNNESPDRWIWVSHDPNTYDGRYQPVSYDLGSNQIAFTVGQIPNDFSIVIRRIWVALGYKDTARGDILATEGIEIDPV